MRETIIVAGRNEVNVGRVYSHLIKQGYRSIPCKTVQALTDELKVLPTWDEHVSLAIIEPEMLINVSDDLVAELLISTIGIPFIVLDSCEAISTTEQLSIVIENLKSDGSNLSEYIFKGLCKRKLIETNEKHKEIVETNNEKKFSKGKESLLILDFIIESSEYIESAEAGLLELNNKPDDQEVLNQIFCAFHSIERIADFLDLTKIASSAHSAENLLDLARKGQLLLVGENAEIVIESIDALKKMVVALKESLPVNNSLL